MADKATSSRSHRLKLPIEDYERQILKAVKKNNFLVIVGETGSGKTTQLPQFLHKAGYTTEGIIGITQPRRVAAISVAMRVSEEMKCRVGDTVGYQVRFDDSTSDKTLIKYMTDGCLLREFLDDAKLSKYSVIILDEAHERSLDTDILFGLVRKIFLDQTKGLKNGEKQTLPLKIIVMSATLNYDKFSEFLNSCPVFEIHGRCYPVKSIYLDYVGVKDLQTPNYMNRTVETVMRIHLEERPGDILVFLTGQEEIEHACDKLFENAEKIDYNHDVLYDEVEAMLILPLYGALTTDLQRRVFDPTDPSTRKVVVATNIAATSLTIEGIRYVVDCGFVKQLSYNPRTRLDSLNVVLISRSEAIQRAGRAGRTAPGKCYRLFSQNIYESAMTEETVPEIQRTSLGHVILYLKSMGIHDVLGFQYIDPPEERMILEALKQLYFFGALDSGGDVTSLGRQMTEFPLSPGLSKTLIHSVSLGCKELVLPVAAMLSVENVFVTPSVKKKLSVATQEHRQLAEKAGGTNDFATLLYIYRQCHSSSSPSGWCRDHYIHWRALKMAYNIYHQLEGILRKQTKQHIPPMNTDSNSRELLRKALCSGYFCNVARKSGSGKSFRTMDGHGTQVYIHPSSALFGFEDKLDWIIFHDIIWTSKIYVRTVCPIRYEWVRDLLPRLHEVDSYSLSGWAEGKVSAGKQDGDQKRPLEMHEDGQKHSDSISEAAKSLKRTTADSIVAAKQRYLERKKARGSLNST